MAIFKLKVLAEDPMQLGSFLLHNGFSKQEVVRAKAHHGMILVNHRRRYTNYYLKEGDEVIFVSGQETKNPWLKPSKESLPLVKEDQYYLVINKPAGVLSIPSRYEDDDAIVNRIIGKFQDSSSPIIKPHVITRLDRDTSGLMLVGKNAIAHARFSKIDKNRFIKKYHAIVHGNFSEHELSGLIDAPIGKIDDGVKRTVISTGQSAQTEYCVLQQVPGASLVELRLLTGRTHQIRVHMAHIGHILFGDELYGANDKFPRQALNCCYLAFEDPFDRQNRIFEIADPTDMTSLWQKLVGN